MGVFEEKEFTAVPEKYSEYKGSYIMAEVEVQDLKKKYIMDQLVESIPQLNDYTGDRMNFGDVLRHLEEKGVDIRPMKPLLNHPARLSGFPLGTLYVPCSQFGNNK